MRTVFRLVVGAALLGALAVAVSSSASATPTITPTFSFTVNVPTTIARGQLEGANIVVLNHTQADAIAYVSWQIVGPKSTAMFGHMGGVLKPFNVPAGQTVTKSATFTIPLRAPIGVYTLTVTVQGALAPINTLVNVT